MYTASKWCAHYTSTKSNDGLIYGNQGGIIANQSKNLLIEGNFPC